MPLFQVVNLAASSWFKVTGDSLNNNFDFISYCLGNTRLYNLFWFFIHSHLSGGAASGVLSFLSAPRGVWVCGACNKHLTLGLMGWSRLDFTIINTRGTQLSAPKPIFIPRHSMGHLRTPAHTNQLSHALKSKQSAHTRCANIRRSQSLMNETSAQLAESFLLEKSFFYHQKKTFYKWTPHIFKIHSNLKWKIEEFNISNLKNV